MRKSCSIQMLVIRPTYNNTAAKVLRPMKFFIITFRWAVHHLQFDWMARGTYLITKVFLHKCAHAECKLHFMPSDVIFEMQIDALQILLINWPEFTTYMSPRFFSFLFLPMSHPIRMGGYSSQYLYVRRELEKNNNKFIWSAIAESMLQSKKK